MIKVGDRVRVISTHMGENDAVDKKQIGMVGTVVRLGVGTWDNERMPVGVKLDGDAGETYFAFVELEVIGDLQPKDR